jgi:glycosyltransferase involved in cell wall biosynthesis
MLQALCDADILLYPSYHHGLATLILQAMWAGLPIVAMLDDPVAQAVGEGAGLVATGKTIPGLLDDLMVKTLQLVDSSESRHACGQRGQQLIAEKYNWQTLCRELNNLLKQVVLETKG